jgi:hypothetical protein
MKKRVTTLLFYLLAVVLVFISSIVYYHYNSFIVFNVKLREIADYPGKTDDVGLIINTLSDFPPNPLIPATVRGFFGSQPLLCFTNADGSPLLVDDAGKACFREDYADNKIGKPHTMEKSGFYVGFRMRPNDINRQQLFFKSIKKQKGVWAKLTLAGFVLPPPVDSKPFFISFEPYCKQHAVRCERIFGWKPAPAQ